jgi:HK97 family phage prohead protease
MKPGIATIHERKFLAEPLKGVDGDGVFEGYASLFGEADLGRDVVMPGAFSDTLRKRGATDVRLLWQHDPGPPIGRWLLIEEDRRGLRVRGKLNLAVERAREIHALMREGAVDGLSIGFRVERARAERPTGLRRLEKLDLWEISVVTFPMLPDARVETVKAAGPKLAASIRKATVRLLS